MAGARSRRGTAHHELARGARLGACGVDRSGHRRYLHQRSRPGAPAQGFPRRDQMIGLGITNSNILFETLSERDLDIDYIKVDADNGMDTLQQALRYRPVLLHDVPDP